VTLLDRFRLDGKVAVVTGGSSGLGVAFAEGLADAGADLVICGRRRERLEATKALVDTIGRRCIAVVADVAQPEDCERVVAEAVRKLGRVDVLVNNAGLGTAVPASRELPEEFRQVVDVNLNGCYWMAQACGRAMVDGGSIINIGSVLGLTSVGLPQAAYSSTKAAIIGLTRDLARQWSGRKGIRVNALAPGFFPSEMVDLYTDDFLAHVLERVPMGRLGDPSELTTALIFLASDAGSFVTGTVLTVDGGLLTN
jgi:NAD(P)-dependent dehydrogenase (short-subunit alcohol dehydrogenase family)